MKIRGRSTSLTWHSLPLEGLSVPDAMIYSIPMHRTTMTQSCRVHQCGMKINWLNEKYTYLFPGTSRICGSPGVWGQLKIDWGIRLCTVELSPTRIMAALCFVVCKSFYGISSDWIQGQAKSCMHMCEAQWCWEVRCWDVGGGERRRPGASMRKMLTTLPLRTSQMGYVSPIELEHLLIAFIFGDIISNTFFKHRTSPLPWFSTVLWTLEKAVVQGCR